MKLSMIVAMDRNNAIGKENALPWRLPADLANFKALTSGKIIIMGRKTWDSLGRRPLPNRKHIVVTRNWGDFIEDEHAAFTPAIDNAIKCAEIAIKCRGYPDEVFVIGGAEVYHQMLSKVDRLYVSRIDLVVDGADAHFPEIDRDVWRLDLSIRHTRDNEKNTHDWHY
ncbi:hypothetical protein pEaSNUABM29_00103 [Erwinia phage pEa_SNUABM_29]|nr:hypothetical protein pEaSNUABM29_00103 [Erwinia phage pEa_SNUABM_29]